MTSEPDRTIPAEALEAAKQLREFIDITVENSEGVPWSFFRTAVAGLAGQCERVLALEVDNRARMPISTETAERIASSFVVPDDPRGVDDESPDHRE